MAHGWSRAVGGSTPKCRKVSFIVNIRSANVNTGAAEASASPQRNGPSVTLNAPKRDYRQAPPAPSPTAARALHRRTQPCGEPHNPLKRHRPRKAGAFRGRCEEFGSFLLSRAKMRSSIGEEELNCRVRNGFRCTLFSVAAKSLGTGAVTLFRRSSGVAPAETSVKI